METFFGALVSISLLLTWSAGTKASGFIEPSHIAANICAGGTAYQLTAATNAASLTTASVAPFGRVEDGWEIYAPQIARTIGTPCEPDTPGFAATLAKWQTQHRVPGSGQVNGATLAAMKERWQTARPFVDQFQDGGDCPEAPSENTLADVTPREGWLGKLSKLDANALAALREMIAAARQADPRIAADPQMLQIVSAFRSPEYDAARCAKEHNCNGLIRARCSAHRTGRAVDLFVGALPGQSPVSTDDANRLFQTRTPAYRWLVANAARFGFVNYVFEPWHWEWTGTKPAETGTVVATAQPQRATKIADASMTGAQPLVELSVRLKTMFGFGG